MIVRPRLDSLDRIAKALNIDIKQLFDEIEELKNATIIALFIIINHNSIYFIKTITFIPFVIPKQKIQKKQRTKKL